MFSKRSKTGLTKRTISLLSVLFLCSCNGTQTLKKASFYPHESKGVYSPYVFSLNDASLKPPLPSLHEEDPNFINYINVLVIPISFDGRDLSKDEIAYLHNGPVAKFYSVNDILKENSNGKCLIRFAIADTVREKRPAKFDPYAFPSDFLPRWLKENEKYYPIEKFDSDNSGGYDCVILEDVSKEPYIQVNGYYPPNIDKVDGLCLIEAIDPGIIAHEIGHALGLPDTYETYIEEEDAKEFHLPCGGAFTMDGAKHCFTDYEKWLLNWSTPQFFDPSKLEYTLSKENPSLFFPAKEDSMSPYEEYLCFSYYDSTNRYSPTILSEGDQIGVYISHTDGRLYDTEKKEFVSAPSKNVTWAFDNTREGKVKGISHHPQQWVLKKGDFSDYDTYETLPSKEPYLRTQDVLFSEGDTFNPNKDYLFYGEDNSHTERFGYSVSFKEEDGKMKIKFCK